MGGNFKLYQNGLLNATKLAVKNLTYTTHAV